MTCEFVAEAFFRFDENERRMMIIGKTVSAAAGNTT